MSHKRTEIRQACVASLVSAATAAGSNIFSNRAISLFGVPLPAINVLTTDESSDPESVSDAPSLRTLQLAIDIFARVSENLDDELDAIALEVEGVMANVDALGDNAIDCRLDSTAMDLAQIGEDPAGVTRLVYSVTYLA
jgi:hypothetical protein